MSDPSTTSSTMAPALNLTLILAATPSLGIGRAGALPWPMLKQEMAYFARVTKRIPAPSASSTSSASSNKKKINAVIMGRKTWDSIPPKFRPLKGRLNVVITRDIEGFRSKNEYVEGREEGPVVVDSISSALATLQMQNISFPSSGSNTPEVERAFVIGGGSIYKAALELPQANRVLLTKIKEEFECDAFFGVDLDKDEGWRRVEHKELEGFVGEEVKKGGLEEGGVGFEFCLYERVGGQ